MAEAGTAIFRAVADFEQLRRGSQQAAKSLEGVGTAADRSGSRLSAAYAKAQRTMEESAQKAQAAWTQAMSRTEAASGRSLGQIGGQAARTSSEVAAQASRIEQAYTRSLGRVDAEQKALWASMRAEGASSGIAIRSSVERGFSGVGASAAALRTTLSRALNVDATGYLAGLAVVEERVQRVTQSAALLGVALEESPAKAAALGQVTRQLGLVSAAVDTAAGRIAALDYSPFVRFNALMDGTAGKVNRWAMLASGAFAGFGLKLSSDLNEAESAVEATFGQGSRASQAVLSFGRDASRSIGEATATADQFAAQFAAMLNSIFPGKTDLVANIVVGGDTKGTLKDFAKFSGLLQDAGDMASFFNTSVEDALMSLKSGLSGEIEPLRRYGVRLTQERIAAEALSEGLVKVQTNHAKIAEGQLKVRDAQKAYDDAVRGGGQSSDTAIRAAAKLADAQEALGKETEGNVSALDGQQKALATIAIIEKDLKSSGVMGDRARTADQFANRLREAGASVKDMVADLGSPWLDKAAGALGGFVKVTDGIRQWPDWIKKALGFLAAGVLVAQPLMKGLAAVGKFQMWQAARSVRKADQRAFGAERAAAGFGTRRDRWSNPFAYRRWRRGGPGRFGDDDGGDGGPGMGLAPRGGPRGPGGGGGAGYEPIRTGRMTVTAQTVVVNGRGELPPGRAPLALPPPGGTTYAGPVGGGGRHVAPDETWGARFRTRAGRIGRGIGGFAREHPVITAAGIGGLGYLLGGPLGGAGGVSIAMASPGGPLGDLPKMQAGKARGLGRRPSSPLHSIEKRIGELVERRQGVRFGPSGTRFGQSQSPEPATGDLANPDAWMRQAYSYGMLPRTTGKYARDFASDMTSMARSDDYLRHLSEQVRPGHLTDPKVQARVDEAIVAGNVNSAQFLQRWNVPTDRIPRPIGITSQLPKHYKATVPGVQVHSAVGSSSLGMYDAIQELESGLGSSFDLSTRRGMKEARLKLGQRLGTTKPISSRSFDAILRAQFAERVIREVRGNWFSAGTPQEDLQSMLYESPGAFPEAAAHEAPGRRDRARGATLERLGPLSVLEAIRQSPLNPKSLYRGLGGQWKHLKNSIGKALYLFPQGFSTNKRIGRRFANIAAGRGEPASVLEVPPGSVRALPIQPLTGGQSGLLEEEYIAEGNVALSGFKKAPRPAESDRIVLGRARHARGPSGERGFAHSGALRRLGGGAFGALAGFGLGGPVGAAVGGLAGFGLGGLRRRRAPAHAAVGRHGATAVTTPAPRDDASTRAEAQDYYAVAPEGQQSRWERRQVRRSYRAFRRDVRRQYRGLKRAGLTMIDGEYDRPYGAYDSMRDYFADVEGGTSRQTTAFNDPNRLMGGWRPTKRWRQRAAQKTNMKFRHAHDYYGHYEPYAKGRVSPANPTDREGEWAAWQAHAPMFSDAAQNALALETRGQNAAVHYGPGGEARGYGQGTFADQKAGLLPGYMYGRPRGRHARPTLRRRAADVWGRAVGRRHTIGVTPWVAATLGTPKDYAEATAALQDQSALFDEFERDAYRIAKDQKVRIDRIDRTVGTWEGEPEPTTRMAVSGSRRNVRKFSGQLAALYGQDAAAMLTHRMFGGSLVSRLFGRGGGIEDKVITQGPGSGVMGGTFVGPGFETYGSKGEAAQAAGLAGLLGMDYRRGGRGVLEFPEGSATAVSPAVAAAAARQTAIRRRRDQEALGAAWATLQSPKSVPASRSGLATHGPPAPDLRPVYGPAAPSARVGAGAGEYAPTPLMVMGAGYRQAQRSSSLLAQAARQELSAATTRAEAASMLRSAEDRLAVLAQTDVALRQQSAEEMLSTDRRTARKRQAAAEGQAAAAASAARAIVGGPAGGAAPAATVVRPQSPAETFLGGVSGGLSPRQAQREVYASLRDQGFGRINSYRQARQTRREIAGGSSLGQMGRGSVAMMAGMQLIPMMSGMFDQSDQEDLQRKQASVQKEFAKRQEAVSAQYDRVTQELAAMQSAADRGEPIDQSKFAALQAKEAELRKTIEVDLPKQLDELMSSIEEQYQAGHGSKSFGQRFNNVLQMAIMTGMLAGPWGALGGAVVGLVVDFIQNKEAWRKQFPSLTGAGGGVGSPGEPGPRDWTDQVANALNHMAGLGKTRGEPGNQYGLTNKNYLWADVPNTDMRKIRKRGIFGGAEGPTYVISGSGDLWVVDDKGKFVPTSMTPSDLGLGQYQDRWTAKQREAEVTTQMDAVMPGYLRGEGTLRLGPGGPQLVPNAVQSGVSGGVSGFGGTFGGGGVHGSGARMMLSGDQLAARWGVTSRGVAESVTGTVGRGPVRKGGLDDVISDAQVDKIAQLTAQWGQARSGVTSAIGGIVSAATAQFGKLWTSVPDLNAAVTDDVQRRWSAVQGGVGASIGGTVADAVSQFGGLGAKLAPALGTAVQSVGGGIAAAVGGLFGGGGGVGLPGGVFGGIGASIAGQVASAAAALGGLPGAISAAVPAVAAAAAQLGAAVSAGLGGVPAAVGGVGAGIAAAMQGTWAATQGAAAAVWAPGGPLWASIVGGLQAIQAGGIVPTGGQIAAWWGQFWGGDLPASLSAGLAQSEAATKAGLGGIAGRIGGFFAGLAPLLSWLPGVQGSVSKVGAGIAAAVAGMESGGLPGVGSRRVGSGFSTAAPTVIVGEGSKVHPEVVVPTDPKHRSRAAQLLAFAAGRMGLGPETVPPPNPEPMFLESGGVVGKISEFGGRGDPGAAGGMAYDGTTVSALAAGVPYAAMRLNVGSFRGRRGEIPLAPKSWVTINYNGKDVRAQILDWGPAAWTGRVIDVSPDVMAALGAHTDAVVSVRWDGSTGPLDGAGGGGDAAKWADKNAALQTMAQVWPDLPLTGTALDFGAETSNRMKVGIAEFVAGEAQKQQQESMGGMSGVGGLRTGAPGSSQDRTRRAMAWALAAFPGTTNMGIWASGRHVANSDHYRGAAADIGVSARTQLALGNAIAAYFANTPGAFGTKYVIWNRQINTLDGRGWRPYSGPSPHTDHVHVSFLADGGVVGMADGGVIGEVPVEDVPRPRGVYTPFVGDDAGVNAALGFGPSLLSAHADGGVVFAEGGITGLLGRVGEAFKLKSTVDRFYGTFGLKVKTPSLGGRKSSKRRSSKKSSRRRGRSGRGRGGGGGGGGAAAAPEQPKEIFYPAAPEGTTLRDRVLAALLDPGQLDLNYDYIKYLTDNVADFQAESWNDDGRKIAATAAGQPKVEGNVAWKPKAVKPKTSPFFEGLTASLKSAMERLGRNDLIAGMQTDPRFLLGLGGVVPVFHSGGIVDSGPGNRDVLALLQRGEGVIAADVMRRMQNVAAGGRTAVPTAPPSSSTSSGGGPQVVQTWNVKVASADGLDQWMRRAAFQAGV